MRVCMVQLEVCKRSCGIESRLEHITTLVKQQLEQADVDIILLPETAFSNYCMLGGKPEALEKAKDEPAIIVWASAMSVEYGCYLAFGLVSLVDDESKLENQLKLISPQGQLVHQQSKRFLYYSDLSWASSPRSDDGEFAVVELVIGKQQKKKIRAMFAICNDINAPNAQEMNQHHLAQAAVDGQVDVLFLAAAWCSAHPESAKSVHDAPITVMDQLEYWYERLLPLVEGRQCYFCVADLVGREPLTNLSNSKRIRYCGTSCCVDLKAGKLLARPCSTHAEEVLVVDLPFV